MSDKTMSLIEFLDLNSQEFSRLPVGAAEEVLQNVESELEKLQAEQKPEPSAIRLAVLKLAEMSQEDWNDLEPKTQRKILKHLSTLEAQSKRKIDL